MKIKILILILSISFFGNAQLATTNPHLEAQVIALNVKVVTANAKLAAVNQSLVNINTTLQKTNQLLSRLIEINSENRTILRKELNAKILPSTTVTSSSLIVEASNLKQQIVDIAKKTNRIIDSYSVKTGKSVEEYIQIVSKSLIESTKLYQDISHVMTSRELMTPAQRLDIIDEKVKDIKSVLKSLEDFQYRMSMKINNKDILKGLDEVAKGKANN